MSRQAKKRKPSAARTSPCSPTTYIHGNENNLYLWDEDIDVKKLAKELITNTTVNHLAFWRNIDDDGAVEIASVLQTSKSLDKLEFSCTRIGDVGIAALAQGLMQNVSLTSLGLSESVIGMVGLSSLANTLKTNKVLTSVTLDNNSVNDKGAAILADALKANTTLRYLYMPENDVADAGAAFFGEAMKCNTTLKVLDLGKNSISDDGAAALLHVLNRYNSTLTGINLADNADISSIIVSAIDKIKLANYDGIRLINAKAELDLSWKWIDDEQTTSIAKDLAINCTVTTLRLNGNRISSEGSAKIAGALVKNLTLTSIKLDSNLIQDAGASAIASMLNGNSVLTKLYLDFGSIGSVGAAALAQALRRNACLQVLGVGGNGFGNQGCIAFANALKYNTALTTLDLCYNHISNVGATAMLTALTGYNCAIASVNLEGNAAVLPTLQEDIKNVLTSRRVFYSLLQHSHDRLEERLIPLVVESVNRGSGFNKRHELADCNKAAGKAGFIYHLVSLQWFRSRQ
jgi:NLR family CARD domain-containing protein 3